MAEEEAKPPRVLITGATGLLGRALVRVFHDFTVLAVAYSRVKDTSPEIYKRCDLTNVEETESLVRSFQPDVIIHAAAERRVDVAEKDKERTEKLNVESVRTLARLSQEVGAFLLFISTDFVFDGINPPNKPNSKRNPLNYYGDTKSRAEEALWESKHKGGVLRVPLLYGRVEFADECFLTQLIQQILKHAENLKNGIDEPPIVLDTWQIRSPTLVDDVAVACLKLFERKIRHCSLTGTWHFSANRKMTKYDVGLEIVRALGLPETLIEGKALEDPRRPRDATLDATALYLMGIGNSTPFNEGLKVILDDLRQRKDIGINIPN